MRNLIHCKRYTGNGSKHYEQQKKLYFYFYKCFVIRNASLYFEKLFSSIFKDKGTLFSIVVSSKEVIPFSARELYQKGLMFVNLGKYNLTTIKIFNKFI